MTHASRCLNLFVLTTICLFAGCEGGTELPSAGGTSIATTDGTSAESEAPASGGLTTAAINPVGSDSGKQTAKKPSEKGSPQWLIAEMKRLRSQSPATADETDVAKLKAARTKQQEDLIQMATEAIVQTHEDPAQAELFTEAVHQLMESRLQLALLGGQENIDALYGDAEALKERQPQSKAAAEAAFAVARFANQQALLHADKDPKWLPEFARQARLFATSFPQEETRAVPLLFAAGWSCELHGMNDEALGCYTQIRKQFPETPQGKQVDGILRRLQLKGQSLQLAGPTIDGGFVSIDNFKGKVVLIIYWATDAEKFPEIMAQIVEMEQKYGKYGFTVLGINLDEEEPAVDAFLSQHGLTWTQIFYSDSTKRRWNNPIVNYYGVRDIPAMWLVDHTGIVTDVQVKSENLESQIRALLTARRDAEQKKQDK